MGVKLTPVFCLGLCQPQPSDQGCDMCLGHSVPRPCTLVSWSDPTRLVPCFLTDERLENTFGLWRPQLIWDREEGLERR